MTDNAWHTTANWLRHLQASKSRYLEELGRHLGYIDTISFTVEAPAVKRAHQGAIRRLNASLRERHLPVANILKMITEFHLPIRNIMILHRDTRCNPTCVDINPREHARSHCHPSTTPAPCLLRDPSVSACFFTESIRWQGTASVAASGTLPTGDLAHQVRT